MLLLYVARMHMVELVRRPPGRVWTAMVIHSCMSNQTGTPMTLELTAVFQQAAEGGYVAFVEELPGSNTQGATLEEARANLREAVLLIVEANRLLAARALGSTAVIRERLTA